MSEITRRSFIKHCGAGVGMAFASNLWLSRLFAGNTPEPGGFEFEKQFGVSKEDMRKLLETALSKGGDYADLFFEFTVSNSVVMEEDILKSSSENILFGVGVRVIKGEQTGYGYTNELTFEKIKNAALTAAAIADGSAKVKTANLNVSKPKFVAYDLSKPLAKSNLENKIALVREAHDSAIKYDSRIKKVRATLLDEIQYVTIANSEGLLISDVRPQARLMVSATAEENNIKNTGSANDGGRVGMNFYVSVKSPKEIGEKAAKEALILLTAESASAGEQPVVLGKNQSGVMIHEAVGHPLEADGAWKKTSIMWDKLGQLVANPLVTIYDDATIPNYRGSLGVDDEGVLTENVMLIEKGKLVGYLHDRLSARIMNVKPNGHGRRQTYQDPPIPRMNNTVLAPGNHTPEEIIASVKKGFFAESYEGGMVSGTGKFTFSVSLGYLIEDGKITKPLKNATLIGTNVQIMKEVDMIGNDMGFFLGTCGKDGQSVPVTAGTPTLRIKNMTVGGV